MTLTILMLAAVGILLWPVWRAMFCMTIHRNLKMVHVAGGEHLVICKDCDCGREIKCGLRVLVLTNWYFKRPLWAMPFFAVMYLIALVHMSITHRDGSFEYPPEHCRG
jgi:hypothetical protein